MVLWIITRMNSLIEAAKDFRDQPFKDMYYSKCKELDGLREEYNQLDEDYDSRSDELDELEEKYTSLIEASENINQKMLLLQEQNQGLESKSLNQTKEYNALIAEFDRYVKESNERARVGQIDHKLELDKLRDTVSELRDRNRLLESKINDICGIVYEGPGLFR